jgi:NADH-quinone oxidoreductase subunit E
MSFPGRIERENWVSQAKDLAEGKATEFSQRVERGEVSSSKKS